MVAPGRNGGVVLVPGCAGRVTASLSKELLAEVPDMIGAPEFACVFREREFLEERL